MSRARTWFRAFSPAGPAQPWKMQALKCVLHPYVAPSIAFHFSLPGLGMMIHSYRAAITS